MRFGFGRDDRKPGVVIISGSCCIPGMAAFDEQARRVVDQAIAESGVAAQVKVMPVTTAYAGGAPREVMAKLISSFNNAGQVALPVVLINGKAVSFGVPQVEDVKAALLQATAANIIQEEPSRGK